MAFKYSVILTTLAMVGGDAWENPREILQMVADAGYDGVDVDAEPDRIAPQRMQELVDISESLGLEVAGLVGAWGGWHAGEQRDLTSSDATVRSYGVEYAKKCVDLSASLGGPVFLICAAPLHPEYPISSVPLDVLRRNFVMSATEIAEHAVERQVPVAIEPINRFEGCPGFLNNIVDAVDVVEEVGLDSLGVMASLLSM